MNQWEANKLRFFCSTSLPLWPLCLPLKCAVVLWFSVSPTSFTSMVLNHQRISDVASGISGYSHPNIAYLARIMRILVFRNIFTAHHPSDGAGKSFAHVDTVGHQAPFVLMKGNPRSLPARYHLSQYICQRWESRPNFMTLHTICSYLGLKVKLAIIY